MIFAGCPGSSYYLQVIYGVSGAGKSYVFQYLKDKGTIDIEDYVELNVDHVIQEIPEYQKCMRNPSVLSLTAQQSTWAKRTERY